MSRIIIVVALLCLVGLAAADQSHIRRLRGGARARGGHWGYKTLGADWEGTCSQGKQQSPINIDTYDVVDTKGKREKYNMEFNYKAATGLSIDNNGHTVIVKAKDGNLGYLNAKGARYNVLQFHFHAPSEHTVDGESYPLELHVVHQKEGATGLNDLLVVGVFFAEHETKKSSFLKTLSWKELPAKNGDKVSLKKSVDLNMLMSALDGTFYAYHGSLTTPTCDETVSWRVFKKPLSVSRSQLRAIQALFSDDDSFANGNGNNRDVQPLNGRTVRVIRRK